MEKTLAGKPVIITGGNRGIGLSIARTIGSMGGCISICGRDEDKLEEALHLLKSEGIEASGMAADVTSPASVEAFVSHARKAFGSAAILVNNAGIGIFRPVHEFPVEEWDRVLDTDLKGVFLMSRAVVPEMIRIGGGHIINIASLAGKNAFAGGSAYCAAKWGLLGLTHSMAEDLRDSNIRVSAVCPGSVATDFSTRAGRDVTRMLQPEDVAHAVAMILAESPRSFLSEISLRPARKP